MKTNLLIHAPILLIYLFLGYYFFKNAMPKVKWFVLINCIVGASLLIFKIGTAVTYFQGDSGNAIQLELSHVLFFLAHILILFIFIIFNKNKIIIQS